MGRNTMPENDTGQINTGVYKSIYKIQHNEAGPFIYFCYNIYITITLVQNRHLD